MDNYFDLLSYPIAFRKPRLLTDVDHWHPHIPFCFAIMAMLKPARFVELGTWKGDSYCAFCQAVDELGLNTACYAIDSWQGDEHAGFYGEEVFEELRAYHDPLYGVFSRLTKCFFDDALDYFTEASIDLLHIDGHHSYDSVKHDFESWLPKMSNRGVVLFHDTNVREMGFGVWRLWREISDLYPSFEFKFGHGLGVLAVGENVEKNVRTFLDRAKKQEYDLESLFFNLGRNTFLSTENKKILRELDRLRKTSIQELQQKELQISEIKKETKEKDYHLRNLERLVRVKDQYVRNLEKSINMKDVCIGELEDMVRDKEVSIGEFEDMVRDNSLRIAELQEKDAVLNHIYNSRGWRALMVYSRIKDRVLPQGSWQRALVRSIVNFLRSHVGERNKNRR